MAAFRFGAFTLDPDSRQLLRDGVPVHLSRRAFDALCVLADRRPAAVPKEELHARLWPDTYVVDANLSVVIAEIRRALDDDPQEPRFIRTVHRVGYAFCGHASAVTAPGEPPAAWLVCDGRVVPLADGQHLLGRDPSCGVWLDASGVSRRHACIRVEGHAATIEDLGSKNGTFVDGTKVTSPRQLRDGDRLRIGPMDVLFRQGRGGKTETVRIS